VNSVILKETIKMLVLAACSVVPYKIMQWFSQLIQVTLLNQVPFEEYLILIYC